MSTTTTRNTYGLELESDTYRPLRDCVTLLRAPAGNVVLRTGREFDVTQRGAWERVGHIVTTPAEARRLAEELLELAGEEELELEFELEAIGYGPATLSNDVTDRTGVHPGDRLTARINGTGAALAHELNGRGFELDRSELESMRWEAGACFTPAGFAEVAKLVGDSPTLRRRGEDTLATIEETLEEIGRAVFDSVAETLGAGRSTAEDLDPGDPEDSEIFSRRAKLAYGRRDCI